MSKTPENERLDQLLVSLGHFASRSRARDAIARGTVSVNGKTATKPSQTVAGNVKIAITDPAQAYVSRAALKLTAALDHFGLDRRAMNASTSAPPPAASPRYCFIAAQNTSPPSMSATGRCIHGSRTIRA